MNKSLSPDQAQAHEQNAEQQLVIFARRLLTPVARFLVGRLPLELLTDILKDCMIRAARNKIAREQPAKRITKSAIALMVGIDSRSIGEFHELDDDAQYEKIIDPIGILVEVWANDPQWQDPETGRPRDLPTYGSGLTFQKLVRQAIGRSISYSEVMEVLLKQGSVKRVGKRTLHLLSDNYTQRKPWVVPRTRMLPFFGDMYYCLGLNAQQVLESPEHLDKPYLAGLVSNRSIPAERIAELQREISELMVPRGFEADEILERYQRPNHDGPKFNAGVGWFYWEESQE